MLNLQTIAPTGALVGYSVRRRSDGLVFDAATGAFGPPPRPSPDVPIGLPRIAEGALPNLGRFAMTIPDAITSSWPDGIYEVWFHRGGVIFDGYAVRMIGGDDTPSEFHPEPPPPPVEPPDPDPIPSPLPVVPTLVNGGFDSPALPPRSVSTTAPEGWTGTGPAFHANNGAAGLQQNAPAPDDGQVAVLQGDAGIAQEVADWPEGVYAIYFKFSRRSSTGNHQIAVSFDDQVVSTHTATRTDWIGVLTPGFQAGAGAHRLGFAGLAAADPNAASLIDRVTLVRVG